MRKSHLLLSFPNRPRRKSRWHKPLKVHHRPFSQPGPAAGPQQLPPAIRLTSGARRGSADVMTAVLMQPPLNNAKHHPARSARNALLRPLTQRKPRRKLQQTRTKCSSTPGTALLTVIVACCKRISPRRILRWLEVRGCAASDAAAALAGGGLGASCHAEGACHTGSG